MEAKNDRLERWLLANSNAFHADPKTPAPRPLLVAVIILCLVAAIVLAVWHPPLDNSPEPKSRHTGSSEKTSWPNKQAS